MAKPFDVLVVGELNPDLVLTGDVTPAAGQVEKIIDDASLVLGSSSGIFACGAARLGLKVTFAGKPAQMVLAIFYGRAAPARHRHARRSHRSGHPHRHQRNSQASSKS